MKKNTQIKSALLLLSVALMSLGSCKKDTISLDNELEFAKLEAITISSTSAISGSGNTSDSLYAMEACKKGNKKTTVELSGLSAAITTYLGANYSGFTFQKAYQVANQTTSAVESFVVVIQFNAKPVALKFDAAGAFVKVLELREGRNMKGRGGWHAGGCFDNRDGKQRDTLAISAIPALIKTYMAATYSADTIVHAFVNKDQSIVLISKNVNYFATAFSSANIFIKRTQLPAVPAKGRSIEASALPAVSTAYLTTTYPNFVFKKAFELKVNGVIKGYLVLFDANLTKYAIHFDANGQFVKAVTIR
ncbi:Putative beta-lactamase-inhibitor-like, PepSY-like [Daejeonella rubra]|uniref:Putative beta-lactamase-inhibitor-like, PepSY-like n=1 Tax=Daejeonella rubra TaxID=990371 RepID=A0A1G9N569_9SPHI|nr:PepSY-like domain-containing protein [Daejeonella rubra]SDL81544.1 Putative beta-lactamase-inhibitor-like, PepSY-like [Daejeonella rubra]